MKVAGVYPVNSYGAYIIRLTKGVPAMNIQDEIDRIVEWQRQSGAIKLVRGIDHIAYRVATGDRERATLEYMRRTPYMQWKVFTIEKERSLLTVMKPAFDVSRGFGCDNFPAIVITEGSDAETVVQKYVDKHGARVHHTAYETLDIGKLVDVLRASGEQFTSEQIIGDKANGLLQVFTHPSEFTGEITEYIQRFNAFDGFFLPDNVGDLMKSTEKFN